MRTFLFIVIILMLVMALINFIVGDKLNAIWFLGLAIFNHQTMEYYHE